MTQSIRSLLSAIPFLLLAGCGGDPAPPPEETAQAAPAPAAAAAPTASTVAGPSDPFGYYILDAAKPQPAWAADIDHLHLSTFDMKGDEMVTVPLYGFIRPKSGDDYKLVNPVIDGAHLTFSTQEVAGVSYDFDGQFLASGSFPETPPQGVVLKGKLRQRQGGKMSGETDAEFLYEAGD